jgi:hypothetical protein
MAMPSVTERVATRKAKRKEFRKRTGRVAGMFMERAFDQFSSVGCPLLATGESDQRLPKTRAQIGRKTITPTTTRRIRDITLTALELYTDGSHGVVLDLINMRGNLLGRREVCGSARSVGDCEIKKLEE